MARMRMADMRSRRKLRMASRRMAPRLLRASLPRMAILHPPARRRRTTRTPRSMATVARISSRLRRVEVVCSFARSPSLSLTHHSYSRAPSRRPLLVVIVSLLSSSLSLSLSSFLSFSSLLSSSLRCFVFVHVCAIIAPLSPPPAASSCHIIVVVLRLSPLVFFLFVTIVCSLIRSSAVCLLVEVWLAHRLCSSLTLSRLLF